MALETVLLQIEMRSRRVKIRVKIIVLETVPLQIEMRSRRVKIRVKSIVPETVPFQIEMSKLSSWRPSPHGRNVLPKGPRPGFG